MTTQYLPLTDYSTKYKVSISTLRRRIKAEDIQFVFEDGKYLIQDNPLSTHQRVTRPSPGQSDKSLVSAHSEYQAELGSEKAPDQKSQHQYSEAAQHISAEQPQPQPPAGASAHAGHNSVSGVGASGPSGEEPVLAVANRLLTELKKAYSQILHEKEEQILHLKEEMADLKTLVRVLESENERLNLAKK